MLSSNWSDFSWLVGIIEGEGWIGVQNSRGNLFARVVVSMTDKDVIDKLLLVSGVGKTYGPFKRKEEHHKLQYRWDVFGKEAESLARQLYPYMSYRRAAQVDEMLEAMSLPRKPKGAYVRTEVHKQKQVEQMLGNEYYKLRKPKPTRMHCSKGHELNESNTYVRPNGDRQCRECKRANRRISDRAHRLRKKEENGYRKRASREDKPKIGLLPCASRSRT